MFQKMIQWIILRKMKQNSWMNASELGISSSEEKAEMWKKGRSIMEKCCGPLFLVCNSERKE